MLGYLNVTRLGSGATGVGYQALHDATITSILFQIDGRGMERDPGAPEFPPASRTAAGKLARSSPWWIARCPPDCSVARHWPPCGRTLATRRDSCFAACACARGKRCGSDPLSGARHHDGPLAGDHCTPPCRQLRPCSPTGSLRCLIALASAVCGIVKGRSGSVWCRPSAGSLCASRVLFHSLWSAMSFSGGTVVS